MCSAFIERFILKLAIGKFTVDKSEGQQTPEMEGHLRSYRHEEHEQDYRPSCPPSRIL